MSNEQTDSRPNALRIKEWCTETISSSGWMLIASRAYPELLLCKRKVSILNINKNTVLDEDHVKILNKYLLEVYGLQIPEEVSRYTPDQVVKNGLKVEWIDHVTGRIKMSLTLHKPAKWFSNIFKKK